MTVSWVGDVYVGAETGLVKSVQLHNQSWLNLGGKPSEAKRENEILEPRLKKKSTVVNKMLREYCVEQNIFHHSRS